jgi:hypothetical protein
MQMSDGMCRLGGAQGVLIDRSSVMHTDTSNDYQTLGENAREHLSGVVMDLYKRLEDLSRLHAQHKYRHRPSFSLQRSVCACEFG